MIGMTASDLLTLLEEKGLTLSLAESCTGGMISSHIVDIPGSSECFKGSAVTYSNDAKIHVLGVNKETLSAHGAVSRETSVEMAVGCVRLFDSDIAASVTGIAGPGGATETKPVGTVWMSVTDGSRCISAEHHFKGSRQEIREQSASSVISMIEDFVRGIL